MMNFSRRSAIAIAAAAFFIVSVPSVDARPHYYGSKYSTSSHGYYGPWYNQQHGYYKFNYYYRATPGAKQYSYHYGRYFPKDRYGHDDYYYFYNPASGKYWGRCQAGSTNYEILSDDDKRAHLADIPDSAFKKMDGMPTIPGMSPPTKMIGPPQLEPPDLDQGDDGIQAPAAPAPPAPAAPPAPPAPSPPAPTPT